MIRCEGRIEHSSVSSEAKKPIPLPAKHHVTHLIIQEHHDSANHTGIKGTLNRIRERYWILHGRQAVKRVLRKCVTCKRLEGKPYLTPKTPTYQLGEKVMTLPLVTQEWISLEPSTSKRTQSVVNNQQKSRTSLYLLVRRHEEIM